METKAEKARKLSKQWYQNNKEKKLKYASIWYKNNKQKRLKYGKNWRTTNLKRHKQMKTDYMNKNFFRYRAVMLKYAGSVLNTNEFATKLFWKWIRQKGRCVYTGRKLQYDKTTHIDHIIPRSKGGSNHPDNLQFICSEANLAKSDLTHDDFMLLIKDIMSYSLKQ